MSSSNVRLNLDSGSSDHTFFTRGGPRLVFFSRIWIQSNRFLNFTVSQPVTELFNIHNRQYETK